MTTFRDWLRASNQASTWLGLGLIAGLWTALALHLAAERDQSQRAWTRTTRNLARTVEEHTQRAIRETDKVLLLLRTALESNPEEFDLRRFTASPYFRNDLTLQVAIIGPDGLMLSTNVETSAARVDLSDREHFRVHRASVDDTLFISKPVLGRASGKWSIQVTRRIRAPDGGFGGVIVGSLDPAILAGFYDAIDIGTGGAVTVVGRDGVVRASSGAAGDLGRSILGSPLLAAAAEVEAGTLDSTSLLDGHARMVSFRNVPNYPLVVAVSVPREEISEATDAKAQSLRGYAGLASLLALVAMGISVRSRMRLDATRRELAAARDAAEAATRTRTAFLAMMSHEMRTPLNGVIGMANLMMETPLNAEQARYAATLRDSGDHLLQIINDVLDLTKLESDRVPVEEVAFDLRELAHGVMQIVAPTAQAKGLLLGAHVAADMPKTLRGDPAALRQVLLNLVGNGVKFTQSGHVKVEIAGQPAAHAGRVALRIDVRDSGIGIAPEQLPLLFQEFSQLDGSISRRFGGTGLGLAITKRIVERLGGSVEVQSSPGIGSRFTVNLVLPVENAAPPLPALEGLGVVVASPLALATSALAGTLAEMGAKVEEASDPARTLELARMPECRAVLIDDGFGDALAPLLLRIQARTFGAPRVIVMTGIAGPARPTPLGGKAPDAVVTWPAGEGALATAILGVDLDDAASLADPEDEIVLTGFNVLLAEDNDTNRLVIATQLEKLGHAVQTVVNGKEAVEAVQRGAYDLVLMDIMMPEMDGYAAARAIRALPGPVSRIPIVALTANALTEDAGAARAAGMDEFATKPVTSQELAAIIARVCEDTHDVFDASPPPQPADTTLFFDPVIFAQFADEIGASAANRIAGVFLRDTWERLATMRGKRGDAAELAREAHAIKSAAATFGLTRLSSLAAQLEKTASSLSDDEVEALVAAMEGSFVHAQERLELAAA